MTARTGPQVADPSVRPNVLAYPSATTARYLIFVAALLCSGLFVGNWVHNDVHGEQWRDTIVACGAVDLPTDVEFDDFGTGGSAAIEQARVTACTRDAERTRAAFIFGGAGVITVGAIMLFVLTPRLVERRRRLRPLGPKLSAAQTRFDELAVDAEVAERVELRIGPAAQRDAFSYGIPLNNRIALPPAVAVRWRDAATFDAVVAHELAHVARRDVSLAWLVRSIGFVLAPVLLVPIVIGLVDGDVSLVLDYTWRVVILALVVVLLSNSLLRSREYDADIHAAAQLGDPGHVESLLAKVGDPPPSRWRWLQARHPTPDQRAAAVNQPQRVTAVDFEDGFTSAFLTALAVPLLVSALTTLLATFDRLSGAAVVSSVLVGPILGASVGLAMWRAAVMNRVVGGSVPVTAVALGVGLGFATGQILTLQQAGTESFSILDSPGALLASGLAGAGATVLSASIGELWADVAPGFRDSRTAWMSGLAVNAVLFSAVLWAGYQFAQAIGLGGWALARWVLVVQMSSPQMAIVVGLLALAVLVPLVWRPGRETAPEWVIERGRAPVWVRADRWALWLPVVGSGLGSGLVATASIIVYRVSAGAADGLGDQWDRYWGYAWVSASAAVAAAIAAQVFLGRRGAAAGLVSGVIASMTSSLGYLVFNSTLGGGWDPSFVSGFVRTSVVLGFYGTLLVSVATLLVDRTRGSSVQSSPWIVLVAAGVSLVLAGPLLVGRQHVVPPYELDISTGFTESDGDRTDADAALTRDLRTYLIEVVPDAEDCYLSTLATASQVEAGQFQGQEVAVLRTQVQLPLQQLWDDMSGYRPVTRAVAVVHADLLEALEHTQRGVGLLIAAYEAGDRSVQGAVLDEFTAAATQWGEWREGRDELAGRVLQN